MNADPDTLCTAIYCTADDLLSAAERNGRRRVTGVTLPPPFALVRVAAPAAPRCKTSSSVRLLLPMPKPARTACRQGAPNSGAPPPVMSHRPGSTRRSVQR